jgi:hypothetical protein
MRIAMVFGMTLGCAMGTAAQEGGKAAQDEIRTPYEAVIKQTLETIESLTKTLKTIRDDDSAKGARDEVAKLAEKWHSIQKKSTELPPPAKEEKDRLAKLYKTKLEEAQKGLIGETARVRGVTRDPEILAALSSILEKKAAK